MTTVMVHLYINQLIVAVVCQGSKTDSGGAKSDILGMGVMHEQKLTSVLTNGMEGYMSILIVLRLYSSPPNENGSDY